MATDRERDKAFTAERTRQARRLTALQRDTAAEIERLLRMAESQILLRMASAPKDYELLTLPTLQASIRRALEELERGLTPSLVRGAGDAWQIGIDQVDLPLEAGLALDATTAVTLRAVLPEVDSRQLRALQVFLTDRGRDITVEMANRINEQLGLSMIGVQSSSAVVNKVSEILGGARGRALTLIRTELGRAYSAAGQQRLDQAEELLPGLKKQWRRSGKIHARPDHVAADGQVQEVKKPFIVGGVPLMYPRDPAAPAAHTINCGCGSLPYMEHWEMRTPGVRPFERRETERSRFARDWEMARDEVKIPDLARSADFRSFLAGEKGDHFPVARLPEGLATPIAGRVRTVRLSRVTAAKQSQRHPEMTPGRYAAIQRGLERGTVIQDGPSTLVTVWRQGGVLWEAAIKATAEQGELFLVSAHRSKDRRFRSLLRRGTLIRDGEEQ